MDFFHLNITLLLVNFSKYVRRNRNFSIFFPHTLHYLQNIVQFSIHSSLHWMSFFKTKNNKHWFTTLRGDIVHSSNKHSSEKWAPKDFFFHLLPFSEPFALELSSLLSSTSLPSTILFFLGVLDATILLLMTVQSIKNVLRDVLHLPLP